ncbi:type VI secretion system tip protein TssI/VgrG [Massilia sp. TWP1-3-3]|uniref:type VI secretion system Vgr family protein n=1 Tax=Massilia sp. TWP1-3-3 TaxID=2804573 RepID=UPI003CF85400
MAITAASISQLLLAQFSQETRLLQLTTPLGRDKLLAECVRGEESISGGFEFAISALSTDADIALKSLIGQPALLQLLTSHSRDDLRPFHGYITGIEHSGANGGFARYQLTLGPWTSFLGLGRDSRVFQDMTVFDILDAVFGEYQGKGSLAPEWRFDIADRDVYPIRSLSTQYQESNLAFAERLMAEEGLFYFFEHSGDPGSATLGSHTMVIADHNGSFQSNRQPQIRFTQSGAVMKEDGLDRWRTEMRQQTNALELSSWDYRSLDHRPLNTASGDGSETVLLGRDTLGPYAYETRKQGQRLADHQMQGLVARREVHVAAGTVRTLSPGTTFTLQGQAQLDAADSADGRTFLIVRTVHLMHNNLSAELQADLHARLAPAALTLLIDEESADSLHAVGKEKGERPLYRNRIDAIRSSIPYRSCVFDSEGRARFQRPTIRGQQTAIVVGPAGSVIHTDRDHRVKVQFHWQRGVQSHSRLDHPAAGNHTGAPADDTAGTWVRVATPLAPVAGANWGSHALPRVGQEVLIDFFEGDIDRPVVIGAVYNGSGQADQQNNQVSQGAGVSTGNAPPWFPGEAGAHAHPAVLSGIKTQSMKTSQGGAGAYNQLVMDDSPGQSRLSLQRHAAAHKGTDELNLGHLRHQTDNQRLQPVGFGAELKTEMSAAVRAGKGLLLSTDARNNATGAQLDSKEASAQVQRSMNLQKSMATTAQKHNAKLKNEPAPEKLPAIEKMADSIATLDTKAKGGEVKEGSGGMGEVAAYNMPQLQLSAPSGIVAATPASAIISAGRTSSITAGQDINLASQGNQFHAVMDGISLFTYGKASNADKPNQEVGIKLHAASGKVNAHSQSDEIRVTADKAITVASVTKSVTVAAAKNVMMTAQGAFLKIEGGNIMLHGPGKIEFKASKKELSGPADGSFGPPELPKAKPRYDEQFVIEDEFTGLLMAHMPYCIKRGDGKVFSGTTDEHGRTERVHGSRQDSVEIFVGTTTPPGSAESSAGAGQVAAKGGENVSHPTAPASDAGKSKPTPSAPAGTAPSHPSGAEPTHTGAPANKKPASAPPQRPKGTLNTTKNSHVVAKYEPALLYFRPETFELIHVPERAAAKFEAHILEMRKVVSDYHKANAEVSEVLDSYDALRKFPADPGKRLEAGRLQKAHADACEKVQITNARLRKKLGQLDSLEKFKKGGASRGIVELVPVYKNGEHRAKMVFVNSQELDKSWPCISLAPKDGPEKLNTTMHKDPKENLWKKDPTTGRKKLDAAELKKQVSDVKKTEAKWELYSFDEHQTIKTLNSWTEEFNKNTKWDAKGKFGSGQLGKLADDVIDLKAEAQLMRYVGGVGVDAIWKPLEGKVGLKAEAKAQLSLAEGKVNFVVNIPNRFGYDLKFWNMNNTKSFSVGLIRLQMETVVAGVVGAHCVGELGMEFDKNSFRAVPSTPGPPPNLPPPPGWKFGRVGSAHPDNAPTAQAGPPSHTKDPDELVKGELAVFAGVKVDVDLYVLFQWWNFEKADEQKWDDLAKISPGFSAMAGAGASIGLKIIYKHGKFGIIFHASASWGLGLRGKIAFEVNVPEIFNFVCWFFHQLHASNYEFLEYVEKAAFDAIKDIVFLAIQSGQALGEFMYETQRQIDDVAKSVSRKLDESGKRNALAKRILADDTLLRFSTPETKGMLLYQLTRHGPADSMDVGNYGFSSRDVLSNRFIMLPDRYPERKRAVLAILRWVQTQNEWKNVCWRVTPQGQKGPGSYRGQLIKFLEQGLDMSDALKKMESDLRAKPREGKIKPNFVKV